MQEKKGQLVIGSLIHDVGKLLYRYNDGRNHSTSGYEFAKKELKISNEEILSCIRWHHSALLKSGNPQKDGLCYITYIADNIAAFADRRKKEEIEEGKGGFLRGIPSESIFNILNENHGKCVYSAGILNPEEGIHYPMEKSPEYSESFYGKIVEHLKDCFKGLELTDSYIHSLLELCEADWSYLPSSTNRGELADISLYDHAKMTAAISLCIYDYLEEQKITDYKTVLLKEAKTFYDKETILVSCMDISGIQDFIYTISSKGALKGLRSRSFYLEILMQHIVDELLERLSLYRTNLLYDGGGHCYLLLPATKKCKQILKEFEQEVNQWFLEYFGTSLYLAVGSASCSANALKNEPAGSYGAIFQSISKQIINQKSHRYQADQIRMLNQKGKKDGQRECVICRRSDRLTKDDKCVICAGLEKLSRGILHGEFFSVLDENEVEDACVPLPFGAQLFAETEESLRKKMANNKRYRRSYGKNRMYLGKKIATRLWVGDYVSADTFGEIAQKANGIKRIAVLRADVDNLGETFIKGFERKHLKKEEQTYVTLSRTATFSRKLTLFFKLHINYLLRHGSYHLDGSRDEKPRNAAIIYSGGDDVFVAGAWDDILGFSIDLYESLKKYTENTLTISGGIGMYAPSYPIISMARESGALEENSKSVPGKNAVTLFSEEHSYHWEEWIQNVLGEKYEQIYRYFNAFEQERGKNLLYHMLEFIRERDQEDRLNIARFAYLLSRLRPEETASVMQKEIYPTFAKNMYAWIQKETDRKELITAIYIYVYFTRI